MRLPDFIRIRLLAWARRHMATHVNAQNEVGPDFTIWRGATDNVYLQRWHVIPRNRWANIYLHRFLGDDEDRANHSHPWLNLSAILENSYFEHREGKSDKHRTQGSITFRLPTSAHRVQLYKEVGPPGRPMPCISLFLTGPVVRVWTFNCPKGLVPWFRFVDPVDRRKSGPGCDG